MKSMTRAPAVLGDATQRFATAASDLTRHASGRAGQLAGSLRALIADAHGADFFCRVDDPRLLRTYQLRSRDSTTSTPIGLLVGGNREYAERGKANFLSADAANLGYLRIRSPRGFRETPEETVRRWRNEEPHDKPIARWAPSPYYESAIAQGRPPIVLAIPHDRDSFVVQVTTDQPRVRFGVPTPDEQFRAIRPDSAELADLLVHNRFLHAASAAHPERDVLLLASYSGDEAQLIANTLGRTTHAPNGLVLTLDWDDMKTGTELRDRLPFVVDDHQLGKIQNSLESAPDWLRSIGDEHGWFMTAVWLDAPTAVPTDHFVTRKPKWLTAMNLGPP